MIVFYSEETVGSKLGCNRFLCCSSMDVTGRIDFRVDLVVEMFLPSNSG